jgi:hypothetical protein
MVDEQLVRELRAGGRSPKQIAKALGVRPAAVAPIVRKIAAEEATEQPGGRVIGCWVNPGWSSGLDVDGHPDWPRSDALDAFSGLAGVVVARRVRYGRVAVCGYLIDVYCLGVKDVLGPRVINDADLGAFVARFFEAFDTDGIEAPIDLAWHLVHGAVDYAYGLGFEPHADFRAAVGHLESLGEPCAITFGRDGKPFYMQGPDDNVAKVLHTLDRTVGPGAYEFYVAARQAPWLPTP